MRFMTIVSIIILILLAGLFLACGGNLQNGYRTTLLVGNTRDSISKALAGFCKQRHEKCIQDKAEYKKCIAECKEALRFWTEKILPIINASIKITSGVLESATEKKQKKINWIKVLKPAICGVFGALDHLKIFMGDHWKKIQSGFSLGKAVCDGN